MVKIDFDEGFKKKFANEFPKLSLDQNEKARVCVLDSPIMEYVHTLRKIITENGQVVLTTEKYGKNFEKTREVPAREFVGKFICLGDPEVLAEKDSDPDNCPACKAAKENSKAVEGPKRRFAVHVIKYLVKKGTFSLQEPFQVTLLAWEFSDTRFSTLVDIRTEHGPLNKLDLNLGPCQNAGFQKFDITPGKNCEWTLTDKNKATVAEVYKNQKSADLSPLCGRRVEAGELRGAVLDVVQKYNSIYGLAGDMPDSEIVGGPSTDTTVDDDLSAMLDDVSSAVGGDEDSESASTEPTAEKEEPQSPVEKSAKSSEEDGIEDLDALLAGID